MLCRHWWLVCAAIAALVQPCLAAETCIDMYKIAFEGKKKVPPADVGKLFKQYCIKNMKVSSAKSMEELCDPMGKKADEKMAWVPPETNVTPEIA